MLDSQTRFESFRSIRLARGCLRSISFHIYKAYMCVRAHIRATPCLPSSRHFDCALQPLLALLPQVASGVNDNPWKLSFPEKSVDAHSAVDGHKHEHDGRREARRRCCDEARCEGIARQRSLTWIEQRPTSSIPFAYPLLLSSSPTLDKRVVSDGRQHRHERVKVLDAVPDLGQRLPQRPRRALAAVVYFTLVSDADEDHARGRGRRQRRSRLNHSPAHLHLE